MNLLTALTSNIVDIAVILIVLISCVVGLKKGFVKSLISTFGSLFAIILALLLCSSTTAFLETKFGLITTISSGVGGVLTKIFGEEIMLTTLKDATEVSLTNSNLTAWLIKIVIDVKGVGDIPLDYTVSDVVSPVFGYYITCIISVVGLYIVLRIAFFIIGEFAKGLHKVPIVGFVDKLLGFLFGLIKGVIVVQIIILIIRVVPLGFFQNIALSIEQSAIARFIDKINLFSYMLSLVSEVNLIDTIKALIVK